jgi:hypothetical protein
LIFLAYPAALPGIVILRARAFALTVIVLLDPTIPVGACGDRRVNPRSRVHLPGDDEDKTVRDGEDETGSGPDDRS